MTKLICNPTAGRGRAGALLPDIRCTLEALGVKPDVVLTRGPQEATALAQQAVVEGHTCVIAAGGDGTLQEVVNGLVAAAGEGVAGRLGIIPLGTGNDFVKMLAIPKGWQAACAYLAQGQSRRIDLGRVNGRIFLNNVGIGFDAQVGIEAHKIRWLRGQAVYLAALARTLLLSYHTPEVTIQLDGRLVKQSITLLTIGNGRCAGGGFWLTPHATIDDGLLDTCTVCGLSKTGMLALIPKVLAGAHTMQTPVQMARARRICITSAAPLPIHADGEILSTAAHQVEVEVLPSKLEIIG
jgi:YegS/Rv2252/BmrU family lipid kinase